MGITWWFSLIKNEWSGAGKGNELLVDEWCQKHTAVPQMANKSVAWVSKISLKTAGPTYWTELCLLTVSLEIMQNVGKLMVSWLKQVQ